MNLVLLAGVAFLWFRLNRPAKDDPRLSRGLQLLQSKISIIEDLSDRTDTQFQQLTMLMEQKIKDIQNQMHEADKHVRHIESSMGRSLEVAKIFQDKIPHQEIIERQNTIKYVKAARLAFKGASVEDIAKEIDLPRGELEFIAKVNRTQLQFSESDLPDWIDEETQNETAALLADVEPTFTTPAVSSASLSELGEKFRQALSPDSATPHVPQEFIATKPVAAKAAVEQPAQKPAVRARSAIPTTVTQPKDDVVRKVVFPRVDMAKNLG